MAEQKIEVQEKQELESAGERTESASFYRPYTDIDEFENTIVVSMYVPGGIAAKIDNGVLTVTLPKAKEALSRRITVN